MEQAPNNVVIPLVWHQNGTVVERLKEIWCGQEGRLCSSASFREIYGLAMACAKDCILYRETGAKNLLRARSAELKTAKFEDQLSAAVEERLIASICAANLRERMREMYADSLQKQRELDLVKAENKKLQYECAQLRQGKEAALGDLTEARARLKRCAADTAYEQHSRIEKLTQALREKQTQVDELRMQTSTGSGTVEVPFNLLGEVASMIANEGLDFTSVYKNGRGCWDVQVNGR